MQGLEDASQDLYPPADAYRLGGEQGSGGWDVVTAVGGAGGGGGGVGLGYLPGGAGAAGAGAGAGGWGGGGGGGGAGVGAQGGGGGVAREVDFHDEMLLRAEEGDVSFSARVRLTLLCACVDNLKSVETALPR